MNQFHLVVKMYRHQILKMLGITLDMNMSVKLHLTEGDSSILKQVSKKMRGLWLMKSHLFFKSRKMTAWGLVMSRVLYGIEIWGPAATEKQVNQMQVIQNSIMRWVCAARRGTRTSDLLRMTGMMSIRQLIMYRVLMTGLTALWHRNPRGMSQWNEEEVDRRLQITKRSFKFYFKKMLSSLPNSLLLKDPRMNKKKIQGWIIDTIPWDEKWRGLGNEHFSEDSDEDI